MAKRPNSPHREKLREEMECAEELEKWNVVLSHTRENVACAVRRTVYTLRRLRGNRFVQQAESLKTVDLKNALSSRRMRPMPSVDDHHDLEDDDQKWEACHFLFQLELPVVA